MGNNIKPQAPDNNYRQEKHTNNPSNNFDNYGILNYTRNYERHF